MEETKQQLPQKQEPTKDKIQLWIEKWFGTYSVILVRTGFSVILSFIIILILNNVLTLSKTLQIAILLVISMLLSPAMQKLKFLDNVAKKITNFYVNLYIYSKHEKKDNKN